MRIAVAGYRGFIGEKLMERLKEENHEIVTLIRTTLYAGSEVIAAKIAGADVVINLAGAPIGTRWTRRNRKMIENSRQGVTLNLVKAINGLKKKPSHFISASAVGIYHTVGRHTESSSAWADNYLARVVKAWEEPMQQLDKEVGKTTIRIGVVLDRKGGALKRIMITKPLGFLVIPGKGSQPVSFIHREDLVNAILHIMRNRLEGVINLCAPEPTSMSEMIRLLARESGTRLVFRAPEVLMRIGMGASHIVVTKGQEAVSERLEMEEFRFSYPTIDRTLRNLFGAA